MSITVHLDQGAWIALQRWAAHTHGRLVRHGTEWRFVEREHVPERQLTRRQHQIVCAIAYGRDNGQIARELHLSTDTVKTHIRYLFRKLGANSRAQLVHLAHVHGLLGHRPAATGAGEQASPSAGPTTQPQRRIDA